MNDEQQPWPGVARSRIDPEISLASSPDASINSMEPLAAWLREGKLSYNEHVLEGAEAARGAIEMLYQGKNTGKLVVKVD